MVTGRADAVVARLTALSPEAIETDSLSLEEIVVTSLQAAGAAA